MLVSNPFKNLLFYTLSSPNELNKSSRTRREDSMRRKVGWAAVRREKSQSPPAPTFFSCLETETKENPKDPYSRFSFVNNRVTPSALEKDELVLKVKMDTVVTNVSKRL